METDMARPLAGSQGRVRSDRLWSELTNLLNAVGGGVSKTTDKWKKVWADWKSKTKKKALTIRHHARGTGGGPASRQTLSASGERVLAIMGALAVEGQVSVEELGFNRPQYSAQDDPIAQDDTGFCLPRPSRSCSVRLRLKNHPRQPLQRTLFRGEGGHLLPARLLLLHLPGGVRGCGRQRHRSLLPLPTALVCAFAVDKHRPPSRERQANLRPWNYDAWSWRKPGLDYNTSATCELWRLSTNGAKFLGH